MPSLRDVILEHIKKKKKKNSRAYKVNYKMKAILAHTQKIRMTELYA